jgi:hypothetical protein
MRRIILVVSAAAVIFAVWAVPAAATISGSSICAPVADTAPGNGASNNNAPSADLKTEAPPDNQGTDEANDHSPAFCFAVC